MCCSYVLQRRVLEVRLTCVRCVGCDILCFLRLCCKVICVLCCVGPMEGGGAVLFVCLFVFVLEVRDERLLVSVFKCNCCYVCIAVLREVEQSGGRSGV